MMPTLQQLPIPERGVLRTSIPDINATPRPALRSALEAGAVYFLTNYGEDFAVLMGLDQYDQILAQLYPDRPRPQFTGVALPTRNYKKPAALEEEAGPDAPLPLERPKRMYRRRKPYRTRRIREAEEAAAAALAAEQASAEPEFAPGTLVSIFAKEFDAEQPEHVEPPAQAAQPEPLPAIPPDPEEEIDLPWHL
jgi:hypothetical protein